MKFRNEDNVHGEEAAGRQGGCYNHLEVMNSILNCLMKFGLVLLF